MNVIDFRQQIKIFQVKAWLATLKAVNADIKWSDYRLTKQNKQLDQLAEWVNIHLVC